jgi:hypothetical protein
MITPRGAPAEGDTDGGLEGRETVELCAQKGQSRSRMAILRMLTGLALLAQVGVPAIGTARAQSAGVQWADLTLDEALAKAGELGTLVMVDVYSDHCGQCGDMDRDLWETPTGAALAEGLVAIKIPSDKPAGIPLQRRYPILGLPALLFLRPDGSEVDRLIGYRNPRQFLEEATLRKSGFDPLPEMEAKLAAQPKSPKHLLEVMEKYLYRTRVAEADSLLVRLLEVDGQGQARSAGKALMYMAKYYAYYERDAVESQMRWKTLVERLPHSTSISSGVSETHKFAQAHHQLDAWVEWICAISDQNPTAGRLNYYVARYAHRSGLRHPCLARAARAAHAQGVGPANLDSIAVILEGQEEDAQR